MTAGPHLAPPGLAIGALTEGGATPGVVNRFLKEHSFPVVEGQFCTFVYQGDVDAVSLRHWIYGLPTSREFTRIEGTDVWYYVLELPPDSRVEYKFEVRRGNKVWLTEDPLNPHRAADPFGANSVCHTEGYEVPEWTQPDSWVRAGKVVDIVVPSQVFGGRRRASVYLPARYRPNRRHPLLVVHDGRDYVQFAALKTVLDNLIHRQEIPAVVAVLSRPKERFSEYAASPDHARFVTEELVPAVEARFSVSQSPERRCLMGASLGGIASFVTAALYPGDFGRLLIQSTSFAFSDIGEHRRGPVFDPIARFVNDYRAQP
ncbi:MAG: alpha/beta hydrolase-fold protein, partial [Longimicrobiales bacterium]